MIRILCFVVTVFVISAQSILLAQEPALPGPDKEHQWLQQFVGQWETHSKAVFGPDQPAFECNGTFSARMLGNFWLVNEMTADPGGTQMVGLQTIGYDSVKKKYVGTWVDSMMNHMWKYEGSVDATGKKLTLEAKGPNYAAAGKMALFRDTYEFKSADHIVATSLMQQEDGTWVNFMTGDMRRKRSAPE